MTKLKIGCSLQNGKYEIIKVLGSGNFGITYLATTKIKVKGQIGQMDVSINVAIKEFYMKDLNNRMSDGTTVEGTQNSMVKNYRQKFKKEAINLAKLHHPNIVKVIEVFDENNTTYYVMEYVEGGSLDEYIKSKGHLQEDEALKCTLDIANALSYMHQNRMVHLDLKPKNIMRNPKGHLYLIDFGLSKQYDENGEPESSTSIGLGTPGYAPLEQACYKQDGTLPATLDIYALGASLFKMLTGKTPPESSTILNEGFPQSSLIQIGISDDIIKVVEKAMASVKKNRYQSVDDMSLAIAKFVKNDVQIVNMDDKDETAYDVKAKVGSAEQNNDNLGTPHDSTNKGEFDTPKKMTGRRETWIMTGLGVVVFLLLYTINNIPLKMLDFIGYVLEEEGAVQNWNIGIIGLCISILCLIYYVYSKKRFIAYISAIGCVVSIGFLWYIIDGENRAYYNYDDIDSIDKEIIEEVEDSVAW